VSCGWAIGLPRPQRVAGADGTGERDLELTLALFGSRTAGKPVIVSLLVPRPGETFTLLLALNRHLNRDGLADWFGGLPCPGFPGLSCAVAEDFSHPLGDPEEACTQAALTWLRTGHLAGGPIP